MITKATSPGYLYAVTTDSTCIITDVDTRYNLCKAVVNKQGMFVAIGGSVECSDDNVLLTQASTVSGGTRFEVVTTRPTMGEAGVIYLVPSSSSSTENLYEEWLWVNDEWEQIGSAGLNLNNYAQLTTANTFSAANTFDGNLIKKTSTTALADNSVLNRFEADARYGRLGADNTWQGDQTIPAGHTLTIHPAATIVANSIQGNNGSNNQLNFNSLHLVNIGNAGASYIRATTVNTNTLLTDTITAINRANKIEFKEVSELQFPSSGGILSGVKQLKYKDATIGIGDSDSNTVEIRNNLRFPVSESRIELRQGIISGVTTLNFGDSKLTLNGTALSFPRQGIYLELNQGIISSVASLSYRDTSLKLNQGIISGIAILQNGQVDIRCDDPDSPNSSDALLVTAAEGIKVTAPTLAPTVTIAPSKIEAFQLNADVFGENKYGLRITPESCQLFGLDFAYGDRWVEPNMSTGGASSTAIQGLQLPSELDVIKIDKANISLSATNIASLSFDYANKAYFKAFPNDGQPAIFEFVSGHNRAAGEPGPSIRLGPVDVRKASLSIDSLHKYSLLNKEEVTAIIPRNTLVDYESRSSGDTLVTELKAVPNVNLNTAYGIAIGPIVTANIYRDIAIGGALNTDLGQGRNTLLGYGFSLGSGVANTIAIGQGNNATIMSESVVFIGTAPANTTIQGDGAVAINGATSGSNAVAINGTAQGDAAIAIGRNTSAYADGIAIGNSCIAQTGTLNISTGGDTLYGARCSMLWYGGTSYEDRDNSGYLSFEIGNTVYNSRNDSSAQNDTITISKPNLWSALDRAKYRGAQPYAYYNASAISSIPALEPNSITHIGTYSNGAAIDLSEITLAEYANTVTTAELWIEVAPAGTTITWPAGMLWPDEADPTVAPSFPGPEASTEVGYITQRLYCVTLRMQRRRNIADGTSNPVLIASIAYAVDSKLPNTTGGGD